MTLLDAGRITTDGEHPGTSHHPSDPAAPGTTWAAVCASGDLLPDRGVCALVGDRAVALFRCSWDGALRAVGNLDPYTGASVLSRGLVGTTRRDGDLVPFVASPLRKQRFDLRDGTALDDPSVGVGSWPVRERDGMVEVGVAPSHAGNDRETAA